MRYYDNSSFFGEIYQIATNFILSDCIQRARGFIHNDKISVLGKSAAYRYFLMFTSGQIYTLIIEGPCQRSMYAFFHSNHLVKKVCLFQ